MEPHSGPSSYTDSLFLRSCLDLIVLLVTYFVLLVIHAGSVHDFPATESSDVIGFLGIAAILAGIVLFTNGIQKAGARDYSTTPGIKDAGTFFDAGMPGLRRIEVNPKKSCIYSAVLPGLGQVMNGEPLRGAIYGILVLLIGPVNIVVALSLYFFLILNAYFTGKEWQRSGRNSVVVEELYVVLLIIAYLVSVIWTLGHLAANLYFHENIPWLATPMLLRRHSPAADSEGIGSRS